MDIGSLQTALLATQCTAIKRGELLMAIQTMCLEELEADRSPDAPFAWRIMALFSKQSVFDDKV